MQTLLDLFEVQPPPSRDPDDIDVELDEERPLPPTRGPRVWLSEDERP